MNANRENEMNKTEAIKEYLRILDAYRGKVLAAETVKELLDSDMWKMREMENLIDKMTDSLPESFQHRLFVKVITKAFDHGYSCGLKGPCEDEANTGTEAWPDVFASVLNSAKLLMGFPDEVD